MGELRQRGRIWWIRYYRDGRRFEESSKSEKKQAAIDLLKIREGDIARGVPVTSRMGRLKFDEAVQAVVADYKMNGRDTVKHVERRIKLHLGPAFAGLRMSAITTAKLTAYAVDRQTAGASNAEINRELAIVKRAFRLAMQAGTLMTRPHIPMLGEASARRGFFEPWQLEAVRAHLPNALQPVVTFAYLTGWRVMSEVLPLEWRAVDWEAREVRIDPGAAKSGEPRVYPFTDDVEAVLTTQRAERDRLRLAGTLVPYVFHRKGKRIRNFYTAWTAACTAAQIPGRLLHDFRRSAVRNLELRGVPRSTAMAMVGHKTESIYRRYAIVDAGSLRAAAAKINAAGTITGTVANSAVSGQSSKSA
jgi:integrase